MGGICLLLVVLVSQGCESVEASSAKTSRTSGAMETPDCQTPLDPLQILKPRLSKGLEGLSSSEEAQRFLRKTHQMTAPSGAQSALRFFVVTPSDEGAERDPAPIDLSHFAGFDRAWFRSEAYPTLHALFSRFAQGRAPGDLDQVMLGLTFPSAYGLYYAGELARVVDQVNMFLIFRSLDEKRADEVIAQASTLNFSIKQDLENHLLRSSSYRRDAASATQTGAGLVEELRRLIAPLSVWKQESVSATGPEEDRSTGGVTMLIRLGTLEQKVDLLIELTRILTNLQTEVLLNPLSPIPPYAMEQTEGQTERVGNGIRYDVGTAGHDEGAQRIRSAAHELALREDDLLMEHTLARLLHLPLISWGSRHHLTELFTPQGAVSAHLSGATRLYSLKIAGDGGADPAMDALVAFLKWGEAARMTLWF